MKLKISNVKGQEFKDMSGDYDDETNEIRINTDYGDDIDHTILHELGHYYTINEIIKKYFPNDDTSKNTIKKILLGYDIEQLNAIEFGYLKEDVRSIIDEIEANSY
jgi:hypothetical protein